MTSRTKIVDFMEYKNNKPLLTNPLKITVAHSMNVTVTYDLVINFVYEGRKILVLKQPDQVNTFIFAEAIFEEGVLKRIARIHDHEMPVFIDRFSPFLGNKNYIPFKSHSL